MAKMIKYPEIDLKDVKAVFIDIDDTLYNYRKCHEMAIESCAEVALRDRVFLKSNIDKLIFKALYREFRDIVTQRLIPQGVCRSRLLAFLEMFESLGIKKSYSVALKYDRLYWRELIRVMEPEVEAEIFLKKAFSSGCIIVAVSDMTTEIQIKKLQKLKFTKYIKYIVTSEEVGAEKPNKAIFDLALLKSCVVPENAIMIGDSHEKDIVGASNLGIKSYKVWTVDV